MTPGERLYGIFRKTRCVFAPTWEQFSDQDRSDWETVAQQFKHPSAALQTRSVPNLSRPIWELVIEDIGVRDAVGRKKYGTPLQAGNGRDALVDAYQEALDLVVYLRQAIEERELQSANAEMLLPTNEHREEHQQQK